MKRKFQFLFSMITLQKMRCSGMVGKAALVFALGIPMLLLILSTLVSYRSIQHLHQRAQGTEKLRQADIKFEQGTEQAILLISAGSSVTFFLLTLAIALFWMEARRRQEAEKALQSSEEHFHSLAQSAHDALISADSQGHIIFWNHGAQQLFGYSADEILGMSLTRLMPQRYQAIYLRGLERFLVTGKIEALGKTMALFGLKKDATEFPIELSIAKWENRGETFFTSVIRDTTERKKTEDALRRSEERFRLMVDSVVDYAIFMLDPEGNVCSWNIGAERIKGYQAREIIGRHFSCFYPAHERTHGVPECLLREAQLKGRNEEEGWSIRKDGSRFWANKVVTPIRDAAGVLRGFSKVTHDLTVRKHAEAVVRKAHRELEIRVRERTADLVEVNKTLLQEVAERKRAQEALQQRAEQLAMSEQRFSKIFHASPAPMVAIKIKNGIIVDANESFFRLVGYTHEKIVGHTATEVGLIEEEERQRFRDELNTQGSVRNFEMYLHAHSGEKLLVSTSASRAELVGEDCFIALVIDITQSAQAQARVHYMAHHDALTGLPNRVLMQDRIGQEIAHAHRTHQKMAVLFIDLDHFKHINDSLGHLIGDQLLQMAAIRLQRCLRENDSVARLGGDEFVIILSELAHTKDVIVVADKVLETLGMPFSLAGHELHVSGSIGVSIFPTDGEDAETLMRAADTAMYYAKESGRDNYQFFTPTLNNAAQQRMAFVNRLHQALEHDEFTLYYQPQVDIETGQIFSVEALLRWQKKGKEAISCSEFIAVAEDTGLILPIGEWALRRACQELAQWRATVHPDLRIAVNLSARQFYQPGFENLVARILCESGVPATALELEITEGMLMRPSDVNLTTLEQLSQMGVQLAVDDFGMGYSNLAYLRRFPITTLKIDRSFVSGIGKDPHDMAIVSAIIAMAQNLQLTLIAEGVENAQQAVFLQAHGCKSAQGFYYGYPAPAARLTAMLGESRERVCAVQ